MSHRLFEHDVLFFQRVLKSCDLYAGKLDGLWGPKTETGARAFFAQTHAIGADLGTFDVRSEEKIGTLLPAVQRAARLALRAIRAKGIEARIISGTRSYEEQDRLYEQGRSRPGPIVTRAKGGESNHNFGLAWDIGIWVGGHYDGRKQPADSALEQEAERLYAEAAVAVKAAAIPNIAWGGDWITFKDRPHYEYAVGVSLAEARAQFEAGTLRL